MNYFRVLLLAILFLAPTTPPHTAYLPIVFTPAPEGKSGIAWNKAGYNDVSPYPFAYYHVWTVKGIEQGDVTPERWDNIKRLLYEPYFSCPVRPYEALRDDTVPVQEDLVAQLEALAATGYDGVVYFLNEPNHPSQCTMAPAEAAQVYMQVTAVCPACRFTLPNVSDWDWLGEWAWTREYLDTLQALHAPQPAYGAFHSYRYPITPMVDSYAALLATYGLDVPIAITEYGHCDPATAVAMHHDLLTDERVSRMFWFTAVGYGCTDLFVSTSEDTPTPLGAYLQAHIRP